MLALEVPDKYAMELMGHSTNNMLKTVYQHIFEDKQNQVAQEINSFFISRKLICSFLLLTKSETNYNVYTSFFYLNSQKPK